MDDFVCMECENKLKLNVNACSCGWRKQPESKIDYRCAYIQNNLRCNAYGRIARTCKANSAWYCSDHWNSN